MSAADTAGIATSREQRLIYAVAAGRGALFILPVLIPYFDERIGLSFREFLYTESVFAAVVVAMEVPSGWLADATRRKSALCAGALLSMLGFALLWQADGLAPAMAAQAVIGVGISLSSGADTAFLYDLLAAQGRSHAFRRAEGMRHGIWLYATALSGIAGGLAYSVSADLPFLLSFAACGMSAVAAMLLCEPQRRKAAQAPALDRAALRALLRSADARAVLRLIGYASLVFAGTNVVFWLQQRYYQEAGVPIAWFGLLVAAGLLVAGAAGQHGHRLETVVGRQRALAALPLVLLAVYAVAALFPGPVGITVLLINSAVWGFGWPMLQDALNARIGEARRATVLSIANLSVKLGFIPCSALLGLLEEAAAASGALAGLAAFMALAWLAPGSPLRRPEGKAKPGVRP